MGEEEFQESDVIFGDEHEEEKYYEGIGPMSDHENAFYANNNNKKIKKKHEQKKSSSVPVNIPVNIIHLADNIYDMLEEEEEYADQDQHELVPPHVIIRRRIAGKMMAFSVCTGNGRTLKGRDLSEVRNSILRLTGFLET